MQLKNLKQLLLSSSADENGDTAILEKTWEPPTVSERMAMVAAEKQGLPKEEVVAVMESERHGIDRRTFLKALAGVGFLSALGGMPWTGLREARGSTVKRWVKYGATCSVIPTIANSLRVRSAANAYLSRLFGSPTSGVTWTLSLWVKRGALGGTQCLLHGNGDNTVNNETMVMLDSDSFRFYSISGGVQQANIVSTQVLRDPAAWYHLVLTYDSTQATAANRVSMYVNGFKLTSFTTNTIPSQNYASYINNSGKTCYFGYRVPQNDLKFDGAIANIYFVDGQALPATSFGQVDPNNSSNWVPKSYSGTYGSNGFYQPFNDGSSLTNLCLDRSGNGNNFTASGISLTAGVAYDWLTDTPTNNYPTLSPIDRGATSETISSGNLDIVGTAVAWGNTRSGWGVTSGKWYFEATVKANSGSNGNEIGWVSPSGTYASSLLNSAGTYGLYFNTANVVVYVNGSATNFSPPVAGDVLQIALDLDNGNVWFGRNNVWYSGNPSAGTSPSGSSIVGPLTPAASVFGTTGGWSVNFGQRPFFYTAPTGFKALCTANLPALSGAALKPKGYFDSVAYNGTTTSRFISGLLFQPDLVWVKERGTGRSHCVVDSVRGINKYLSTDTTAAETSDITTIDQFTTDGFHVESSLLVNGNDAYASWLWKAGGASVSNNAGSIVSQVSASPASGFSIVTYTGNGVNGATVGHGLGAALKMLIVKPRQAVSGAGDWHVWHAGLSAAGNVLLLNSTAAQNPAGVWASTYPTSSVFSLGSNTGQNNNGTQFIAYCFTEVPGFSKIGSYTGNSSADGPFVYCGFRPKFLMLKNASDGTATWLMFDSSRDTYNVVRDQLYPNQSSSEVVDAVNNPFDFVSNGFKIRGASSVTNGSGNNITFIAFAESPFGGSNAYPGCAR